MDMGGAWKVARHAMKTGGKLDAFSAYFSGRSMGTYMKNVNAFSHSAMNPSGLAYRAGSANFTRGAVRSGAVLGAAGAAYFGMTRTDTGRRFGRTVAPIAAGVGAYKGLRYGLSKYPKGIMGSGLASGTLTSRGIATLGGLGAWRGFGGGF